jgi:hypothetical protein
MKQQLFYTLNQLARALERDKATVSARIFTGELRADASDVMGSMFLFSSERLDEISKLFPKSQAELKREEALRKMRK